MSERAQWKMIHILNTCNTGKMTTVELQEIGIICFEDTIKELVGDGIVHFDDEYNGPYYLNSIARKMINKFIVASGSRNRTNMYVDQPSCFVIMPFSEPWSQDVYDNFIKPAVEETGLKCIRGDEIERIGMLNDNIFKSIQEAGFIIGEISSPNPNVYYELGVVDALGKETFILFDPLKNKQIPADKKGIHYTEYSQTNLPAAKEKLKTALQEKIDYYKLLATKKYCNITT